MESKSISGGFTVHSFGAQGFPEASDVLPTNGGSSDSTEVGILPVPHPIVIRTYQASERVHLGGWRVDGWRRGTRRRTGTLFARERRASHGVLKGGGAGREFVQFEAPVTSNKKLLETSATLVVTGALLVVTGATLVKKATCNVQLFATTFRRAESGGILHEQNLSTGPRDLGPWEGGGHGGGGSKTREKPKGKACSAGNFLDDKQQVMLCCKVTCKWF